jgi:hypothetical protein
MSDFMFVHATAVGIKERNRKSDVILNILRRWSCASPLLEELVPMVWLLVDPGALLRTSIYLVLRHIAIGYDEEIQIA